MESLLLLSFHAFSFFTLMGSPGCHGVSSDDTLTTIISLRSNTRCALIYSIVLFTLCVFMCNQMCILHHRWIQQPMPLPNRTTRRQERCINAVILFSYFI